MLKYKNVKTIDNADWDNFVRETYGKPYCFQQQNGCQERGLFYITIPSDFTEDDDMNDSIPEIVNGNEMGVKFKVWLERDPNQKLEIYKNTPEGGIILFWERNFYPDIYTVANDLHSKGLIEAGDYVINIDW